MSESKGATDVWSALFNCQSEFPKITKSSAGYNYKYADLTEVKHQTDPVLFKHGLLLIDRTEKTDTGRVLKTVLRHVTSGTEVESAWELLDTTNPQGRGSELTYGRRYNRLGLLGLTPEDDDGESASQNRSVATNNAPSNVPGSKSQRVKPKTGIGASARLDGPTWVVPFGKKFKGRKIGTIPPDELRGYRDYLERSDKPSPSGDKFIKEANALLENDGPPPQVLDGPPPEDTEQDVFF